MTASKVFKVPTRYDMHVTFTKQKLHQNVTFTEVTNKKTVL